MEQEFLHHLQATLQLDGGEWAKKLRGVVAENIF